MHRREIHVLFFLLFRLRVTKSIQKISNEPQFISSSRNAQSTNPSTRTSNHKRPRQVFDCVFNTSPKINPKKQKLVTVLLSESIYSGQPRMSTGRNFRRLNRGRMYVTMLYCATTHSLKCILILSRKSWKMKILPCFPIQFETASDILGSKSRTNISTSTDSLARWW